MSSQQLPINQWRGTSWQFGEEPWPERWQWKTLFIGTGAEIDALDIDTSRTSLYPFNDSLNDVQGSNHLSSAGGVTYGSGLDGRCLNLSSQRAQASAQTVHEHGATDASFSVWINPNAISGTQVIFAKRDRTGNNKGYDLYLNSSGKLVAEFCDGSAAPKVITSSLTLTAGRWYFVKLSIDRQGFMRMLINNSGSAGGSVDISAQSASIATNGQTFTVGSDSTGATNYFNGKIEHLQVFTTEVSDADGQLIYKNLHAGQLLSCIETGSGFTKGYLYLRNEENTGYSRVLRSAGDVDTYLQFLAQGEARFADSDSSHYTAVKAGATIGTSYTITLPTAAPAGNKQVMSFSTAGVATFLTPHMYPISMDDTAGSNVNEDTTEQISKSFSLPDNDYDRILVVFGYTHSHNSDDEAQSVRVAIGASAKAFSVASIDTEVDSHRVQSSGTLMYSAVQTSAATIKACYIPADASPDTGASVQCTFLYVFGLRYA